MERARKQRCRRNDCAATRDALAEAEMLVAQRDAELVALHAELAEALKALELAEEEIKRFKLAVADAQPHCPERTSPAQLLFGWRCILESLTADTPDGEAANENSDLADALGAMPAPGEGAEPPKKRRHSHGRRRLDETNLPTQETIIQPAEVLAAPHLFRCIGEERTKTLGHRPASYFLHITVRPKWVRIEEYDRLSLAGLEERALPPVLIGELPESVWPSFMGDPSVIAHVAVSKYGDLLPLNRQQTITTREGFLIAKSTMCNWLGKGYESLYRIVDAMHQDALRTAFCIATDATGAPVKGKGGTTSWHVFTLIADRDHILFRHSPTHDGDAVKLLFNGFQGYLLADASSVYNALYGPTAMTEAGCWSHARRYFWKARETDRRAFEALALISQLFTIERELADASTEERLAGRRERASPVLLALDQWVAQHDGAVDTLLQSAITYYKNQRVALRQFLQDGRLVIHNNASESALRNLVLGRNNWQYFANENGLKWYCVYRSLIASCALHDLNTQTYLEEVLRLAPHWPITRVLELSPKYWARTRESLDARHRAIIVPPWELSSHPRQPAGESPLAAAAAAE